MATVGLIGVGLLGSAIAERLCERGDRVLGYDVDPAREAFLTEVGGEWVTSPGSVARSCRQIVLSLPNSTIVRQIVDQIASDCAPDTVIIDTTTGSPEDSIDRARQLEPFHVDWLDATVVGSSQQMRQHEAIMLVGGRDSVVEAQLPILRQLAREVFPLGPNGSGARMKLVVNLVLGLNRAVLAEGLSLGRALGFDPAVTLQVLQASAAYSRVMDTKGFKMLRRDFEPQARLAQHLKDVGLILAAANQVGQPVPFSSQHQQLLQALVQAGYGELDNSAIVKAFETGDPNPSEA